MNDKRTDQQRKSIEVYCRELAKALNDAGYEMKAVLSVKSVDVPWTQKRVKDILWKEAVQLPMLGKTSTTELDTDEVDKVYRVLDRHISENFGVHVEFPSIESMYIESLEKFGE